MLIQFAKSHPANGTKFLTVCDYGYFLPRGKWELVVFRLFGYEMCVYRKAEYRRRWPVGCA